MTDTPTTKSLRWLQERYPCVKNAEFHLRRGKFKIDFLGFADFIAFSDVQTVLCQTTSDGHFNERLRKILLSPLAKSWLRQGSRRIVIHGWAAGDRDMPRKILWVTPW